MNSDIYWDPRVAEGNSQHINGDSSMTTPVIFKGPSWTHTHPHTVLLCESDVVSPEELQQSVHS